MDVLDHILQLLVDHAMRFHRGQTLELLGAQLDRVEASAAAYPPPPQPTAIASRKPQQLCVSNQRLVFLV